MISNQHLRKYFCEECISIVSPPCANKCRGCKALRVKAWQSRNAEKVKLMGSRWRGQNKDRFDEIRKAWRNNNQNKFKAILRRKKFHLNYLEWQTRYNWKRRWGKMAETARLLNKLKQRIREYEDC